MCAYVPTAPEILPTAMVSRARSSRSSARPNSSYISAIFSPNVIGSAWTPWVRPIIGANLYFFAFFATTARSSSRRRSECPPPAPSAPPAPCRRHRTRSAPRGCGATPGRRFRRRWSGTRSRRGWWCFSISRMRSTLNFARRLMVARSLRGNLPRLARQNLDLQPDGELVLLRPDLAHRFPAVSSNHDRFLTANGRICTRIISVAGEATTGKFTTGAESARRRCRLRQPQRTKVYTTKDTKSTKKVKRQLRKELKSLSRLSTGEISTRC